ncbi:hypothetical protein FIBSPDRAFT_1043572 [Athelia psychrophila]|uniref:Uncharacterized protein n=1 Tax=Athelia psychrophila TaxID=1759441 RepID=A0A166KV74_9AGAM|nr:hypothetical protein FIBSPDRAFT_1043572 [Fibularhizoctonia sp. CBS 109695]
MFIEDVVAVAQTRGADLEKFMNDFAGAGFPLASSHVMVAVNSDDPARARCRRRAHPGHSAEAHVPPPSTRASSTATFSALENAGPIPFFSTASRRKSSRCLRAQSNVRARLVQRPPSHKAVLHPNKASVSRRAQGMTKEITSSSLFLLHIIRYKLPVAILDGDVRASFARDGLCRSGRSRRQLVFGVDKGGVRWTGLGLGCFRARGSGWDQIEQGNYMHIHTCDVYNS